MRFAPLFLLVCLTALSAVAAPLLVSQSQSPENASTQPLSHETSVGINSQVTPSSKHHIVPRATLPNSGVHGTASNHATIANKHTATDCRTPAPDSAPDTVPTVDEFMACMKVPRDTALFWAGPKADDYENEALKRATIEGWTVIAESWWDHKNNKKDPEWSRPYLDAFKNDKAKTATFWDRASEAFALLAEGDVHVLLPENPDTFFPGTVWVRVEWPTLKANKKVNRVIKVTPGKTTKEYAMVINKSTEAMTPLHTINDVGSHHDISAGSNHAQANPNAKGGKVPINVG